LTFYSETNATLFWEQHFELNRLNPTFGKCFELNWLIPIFGQKIGLDPTKTNFWKNRFLQKKIVCRLTFKSFLKLFPRETIWM